VFEIRIQTLQQLLLGLQFFLLSNVVTCGAGHLPCVLAAAVNFLQQVTHLYVEVNVPAVQIVGEIRVSGVLR
jgi:hypothetical protein